MSKRDFKKVKIGGYVYWIGLNLIITEIDDINKTASREVVESCRELVESKTVSRERVEGLIDILKRYKSNGNSSCIVDIIEKEVSDKVSIVSPDSEQGSTDTRLKTDYKGNLTKIMKDKLQDNHKFVNFEVLNRDLWNYRKANRDPKKHVDFFVGSIHVKAGKPIKPLCVMPLM